MKAQTTLDDNTDSSIDQGVVQLPVATEILNCLLLHQCFYLNLNLNKTVITYNSQKDTLTHLDCFFHFVFRFSTIMVVQGIIVLDLCSIFGTGIIIDTQVQMNMS